MCDKLLGYFSLLPIWFVCAGARVFKRCCLSDTNVGSVTMLSSFYYYGHLCPTLFGLIAICFGCRRWSSIWFLCCHSPATSLLSLFFYVIFLCWLLGVVDRQHIRPQVSATFTYDNIKFWISLRDVANHYGHKWASHFLLLIWIDGTARAYHTSSRAYGLPPPIWRSAAERRTEETTKKWAT